MRVLGHGGTLVQMGVSSPARFEWTPWYFKELRLIGSNAFGHEEVEGRRQHAIAHYLDLVQAGRIDLDGMLTHRFALDDWRDAFRTIIHQGETGAVKVAFDFRGDRMRVTELDDLLTGTGAPLGRRRRPAVRRRRSGRTVRRRPTGSAIDAVVSGALVDRQLPCPTSPRSGGLARRHRSPRRSTPAEAGPMTSCQASPATCSHRMPPSCSSPPGRPAHPRGSCTPTPRWPTRPARWSALHGLTADDTVLMPAPLSHMSGLLNGLLVPGCRRHDDRADGAVERPDSRSTSSSRSR